jgi:hypothetical protein
MNPDMVPSEAAERDHVARAVEVVLDPSPSQERLLRSYAGSMRASYKLQLGDRDGA